MGQINIKLRRVQDGGIAHWCPGCGEIHILPSSWYFDGNLESPTFRPSFRHNGLQRVFIDGKWTGEWRRDATGNTIPYTCHYNVVAGELQFCNDCTHALVNQKVPIPDLPAGFTDEELSSW